MRLADFDFPFDPSLIAAHPATPRDQARLLVVDRTSGILSHHRMADLPGLLRGGDLVVANDTKVLAARVAARVVDTGRVLDILFVRDLGRGVWEVFLKGRLRAGQVLEVNAEQGPDDGANGRSRNGRGCDANGRDDAAPALYQAVTGPGGS
jgi:S-adenosylmethionine:tRNA ribosyltransferase-isomerase